MERPWLSVDGIVLRNGKIVLIYRKEEPKGWALPGGHLESKERLPDACKREVKEETGLEVKILETEGPTPEFGVYDAVDRDPRKRMVTVVFGCKSIGGDLKAETDAKRVDVFSSEKALDLELKFDHKKILKDFVEYRSQGKP